MAPPSKGTNPAPNYTVMMNRVQSQIEAQLRTVRSFLPSKPSGQAQHSKTPTTAAAAAKPTSSFSALASTTSKHTPSSSSTTKAERQNEDKLFEDGRGQDPNAGLGFATISKRTSEKEKERGDQILRSRLLGRKRGADDVSRGATQRRGGGDESSDEEPGRGGLGRAKKRARREESEEKKADPPSLEPPEPEKVSAEVSRDGSDGTARESVEEDRGLASPAADASSVQNGPEGISDQQKKRKKKKKKRKDGSKAETN